MSFNKEFEELLKYANDIENPIVFISKFREFGIKVNDGGTSFIMIKYCPFTGKEIPVSLRNKWFDILEELNLEPGSSLIPKVYNTDAWWNNPT